MDKRTQHQLNKISARIPARLRNNLTKKVVDDSEEKMIRQFLKRKDLPPKRREYLQKLLDKGAFRREDVVVDEEVAAEIDRYHVREIAKANKKGLLAKPSEDPFWRARQKQINEHKRV